MNLHKLAAIFFFYLTLSLEGLILEASGPVDDLDEMIRKSRAYSISDASLFSYLNPIAVLKGVYSVFLQPQEEKLEETFWGLVRLSSNKGADAEDCKYAVDFMVACALKGHRLSMFHLGLILTHQPDVRLKHLVKYIEHDPLLGEAYLQTCIEVGYKPASKSLEKFQNLKSLANVALTLTNEEKNDDLTGAVIRVLDTNNPAKNKFLQEIAEARIAGLVEQIPGLMRGSFERRRVALQLLHLAVQSKLEPAKNILATVIEEDRVYTEICRMMMEDRNKVIREYEGQLILADEGVGIELGEAGFQEAYLKMIWQSQKKVLDRILSQEECEIYAKAMAFRVMSLFHLYSSYFQFCNTAGIDHDVNSLRAKILLPRNRMIVKAPVKVFNSIEGAFNYRILNAYTLGVCAAFHEFELNAVSRKLLDADSDFDGAEGAQITELESEVN